jgi:hypothetical protein
VTHCADDTEALNALRTSINHGTSSRTSSVRSTEFHVFLARVSLVVVLVSSTATAGSAANVDVQQRQQAEGWLQLKQDQKSDRERVGRLAPADAAALDALERQQDLQRKSLEQRQRQSLQLEQRLDRMPNANASGAPRAPLQDQRQLERQRLEMRLQREMLQPLPAPPAVSR